ncbi:s-adenosylmethionine synthetase [Stylonychia lemnae]|uniref:S-adenosylmethionine synthase n=1 Tax=Stylonychia lemnae TaxID=5949 RepID=A0A078B152_STYLE|nr:s-adenosylmethionine synthetase [Stylonychia lemnae]|eukprot:CDW88056.1 s-adenosylmethionine synthetase [Stylonychia lemnae]
MENTKPGHIYFASESVGEGHPDKLCDQISDAVLDECLRIDLHCKVCLLGETLVNGERVNYEQIAREVCKQVGYDDESKGLDYKSMSVLVNVERQSSEIANAVHTEKDMDDFGAGDQGLMFGYATDEWDKETLHPYSHYLANLLCEELANARHSGQIKWLRPDCKSQVIVEYENNKGNIKPVSIYNILISTQHDPDVSNEEIAKTLTEQIIRKVCPAEMLTNTKIVINPSGSFVMGGPQADSGLTGRKIIVDTYGGWAPHGGGAFSGKDPTKVDRSASYYARYVAKSVVAAGLAHRCLVQVSYAIGLADPLSIHVESYNTVKEGLNDDDLIRIVKKNFSFRPGNIIKELNLLRPIYQKTAKYGHFGRNDPDFTWEQPKTLILE